MKIYTKELFEKFLEKFLIEYIKNTLEKCLSEFLEESPKKPGGVLKINRDSFQDRILEVFFIESVKIL